PAPRRAGWPVRLGSHPVGALSFARRRGGCRHADPGIARARHAGCTGRQATVRRRHHYRQPTEEARMTRRAVSTGNAPGAVASYSQAIATDHLVFCAGQIGLDPATGELADGFDAQAEQVLRNLAAVLDAAGC